MQPVRRSIVVSGPLAAPALGILRQTHPSRQRLTHGITAVREVALPRQSQRLSYATSRGNKTHRGDLPQDRNGPFQKHHERLSPNKAKRTRNSTKPGWTTKAGRWKNKPASALPNPYFRPPIDVKSATRIIACDVAGVSAAGSAANALPSAVERKTRYLGAGPGWFGGLGQSSFATTSLPFCCTVGDAD